MAAILTRGTTHGTFPWNIPNKRLKQTNLIDDIYYGCDNLSRISSCLNCNLPECTNCFERSASSRRGNYVKRTARNEKTNALRDTFRKLYEENQSFEEIEKQMGISKSTYQRYKAQITNQVVR